MFSIGAEIDAWDFAQVRVGLQKNMASGLSAASEDPVITAGLGFWVGINIDVAVISANNSVGGIIQTGFKF